MTKLQRKYRHFNRKFFNSRLPKNTKLCWENMYEMGYQQGDKIAINRQDRKRSRVWQFTLLHEMCHILHPNHGPGFQREMLRLAKAGAFKNLW